MLWRPAPTPCQQTHLQSRAHHLFQVAPAFPDSGAISSASLQSPGQPEAARKEELNNSSNLSGIENFCGTTEVVAIPFGTIGLAFYLHNHLSLLFSAEIAQSVGRSLEMSAKVLEQKFKKFQTECRQILLHRDAYTCPFPHLPYPLHLPAASVRCQQQ